MTTQNKAIQLIPLADLVPYANNAKIHKEEQVDKLCKLIERFGFSQPIIVDADMVIIAGHGRRLAAMKLGLKRVPVIVRDDLTKEEANALRLADNRVASTDYDLQLEQAELQLIAEYNLDFDLTALGYSEHELNFATNDLGVMDETIFVDDISEAVERQKEENKTKSDEVDDVAAPVGDALGFKRLTIAESRTLRTLMSKIEARTGKKGAEALIGFLSEHA